jgi:hypothetical protein
MAATNGGNMLEGSSKPYGLTYGEWTAKWWQWYFSLPSQINPANDDTGKNCGQKQVGPVWFLAGASGGRAERSCTIPSGKAILFPIINSECSYAEYPKLKTAKDLAACATSFQNQVRHIEATVDGVALQDLQRFRIKSGVFNLILPPNNVSTAPPGPTQAVDDGNYVFLKPLSPGKHELHFKGINVDYSVAGTNNFVQDITYHLTIAQ